MSIHRRPRDANFSFLIISVIDLGGRKKKEEKDRVEENEFLNRSKWNHSNLSVRPA